VIRVKKQYLQFFIKQKFGSQTDGARAIGIDYFRLSKFINGSIQLKDTELEKLRKKMKLSSEEFGGSI